jgi:hypothetical protein
MACERAHPGLMGFISPRMLSSTQGAEAQRALAGLDRRR